ncbi:MAG: helix-turn-helix domain-containing protein [Candidatus Thermoplasmatota archaeon]|nr:helix-turn-helix domain-containing protein [Candidatus Thermoplasmatota archaeon]
MNILKCILAEPMNAHQLSLTLKLNYRTVEHHMNVLQKNGFVSVVGDGYGQTYFPSDAALENRECIEELRRRYGEDA